MKEVREGEGRRLGPADITRVGLVVRSMGQVRWGERRAEVGDRPRDEDGPDDPEWVERPRPETSADCTGDLDEIEDRLL